MYDNIGGKMKMLAKILFILETISTVAVALSLFTNDMGAIGLLVLFIGPILAWISSWFLYGFGQLIENSDIMAEEYKRKNIKHEKNIVKNNERKQNQIRKEAKAIVVDPEQDEDTFVDIICPHCQAELSYTKSQLQENSSVVCPMCYESITL